MALLDAISETFQRPRATLFIGGVRFRPLRVQVDHGYDVVSARARITLSSEQIAGLPSTWATLVDIFLGYEPSEVQVFKGYLEAASLRAARQGQTNTLEASGMLKLAQYQSPEEVSYEDATDGEIVADLLARAGIGAASVDDSALVLGTVEPVTLRATAPWFELINRVDQVTGYKTFDAPDGVPRRRYVTGIPSATAAWSYHEGQNILEVERNETMEGLFNKVIVRGLPQGGTTPSATRQAASDYVPTPPTYLAYDFSSDLIENDTVADDVAIRLMQTLNHIAEDVTLEVVGNPYLQVAMTISVRAPRAGIPSATNYRIKHITHTFDEDGFVTSLRLEGRVGAEGEPTEEPEALFSMVVTAEAWLIDDVVTRVYTVSCDASASYSPAAPPGALTFAWSNNKNAEVGDRVTYGTWFTEAELATATVTLEVDDGNGGTRSATQAVDTTAIAQLTRSLFLALDDVALVSLDGGLTWDTFSAPYPDATVKRVTVVNEIGGAGINWFGAIGSAGTGWDVPAHWLVKYDPSYDEQFYPVYNFGGAAGKEITAIWWHEVERDRMLVGLANGGVWATDNLSAERYATWRRLVTLPAAVEWLVESFHTVGEIRAAAGIYHYITFNSFASYAALVSFPGGAAKRMALSGFGNYASGEADEDGRLVVSESDVAVELPGNLDPLPTEMLGLTHDIRHPVVYAGDDQGRTFARAEGAALLDQFEARAALASGSPINHMLRDGEAGAVIYIAADDGIYKSYNALDTIEQVLAWDAGTYPERRGLRIGYGGPPEPAEELPGDECIVGYYNTTAPFGWGTAYWAAHALGEGSLNHKHYYANTGGWRVTLVDIWSNESLPPDWPSGPLAINVAAYTSEPPELDAALTSGRLATLTTPGDSVIIQDPLEPGEPVLFWAAAGTNYHSRLGGFEIEVCPLGVDAPDILDIEVASGTDAKTLLLGTAPTGWRRADYDDSAWSAAVEIAGEDEYIPAPYIWRSASGAAAQVLLRHSFDLSSLASVTEAVLRIRANNRAAGIWINDSFVRAIEASGEDDGASEPLEIAINPAVLTVEGDNVLAIHAINEAPAGDDTVGWVAYELTITGPEAE